MLKQTSEPAVPTTIDKTDKEVKSQPEEHKGLLMPFYEFEQDIGTYGFIGNSGVKIVVIKKLENQKFSSDKKLQMICREIYSKFNKLLLNPFYDKREFNLEKSNQRDSFANGILDMMSQNQII